MYGVDFQPLLRRLVSIDPRSTAWPIEVFDGPKLKRRILSDECRLVDIDFYRASAGDFDGTTTTLLKIRQPGLLGALFVYFRAHLDETTILSNGPFVPPTSWGRDVRELSKLVQVRDGDESLCESRSGRPGKAAADGGFGPSNPEPASCPPLVTGRWAG